MAEIHPRIQQDTPCIYSQLDNGIHTFTFTKASRVSIDAFVARMDAVFAVEAPGTLVQCLIDWRQSGIPPLRHLAGRGKEFLQHYPQGPYGRIAFITNQGTMVNITQTLLDVINAKAQKRFFAGDQYDEAVDWLLKE